LESVGYFKDERGKLVQISRSMNTKEMCRVTLRDALFCLEKEKQLRKSGLVYKWMGKIK
jgi:hypothetical protein